MERAVNLYLVRWGLTFSSRPTVLFFFCGYSIISWWPSQVLIRMLPSYYQHVSQYKNSLVTKFLGVHCVKPIGGQKVCMYVWTSYLNFASNWCTVFECLLQHLYIMLWKNRLGLLWWAMYFVRSIGSISGLTSKVLLMVVQLINPGRKLTRLPLLKTLIFVLSSAWNILGFKSLNGTETAARVTYCFYFEHFLWCSKSWVVFCDDLCSGNLIETVNSWKQRE